MNHRSTAEPDRCHACGQPPRPWATDKLTGLLDRWGWDAEAARALAATGRRDEPAALLLLDLDHFKGVNDTLGHPAGDAVLHGVAGLLRTVTGPAAVLGRYGGHGGDEFLALLPGHGPEAARALAARVRAAVPALRIPARTVLGPRTVTGLTVSIGLASRRAGDRADLTDLVLAADSALLLAKRGGRDQVRDHREERRPREPHLRPVRSGGA
ncbi:diguanylate cyclase (GGDEF)-like protein [Crossiella equi]|uniref:Diguanylate cyclase (GGDEF)-like protein n=1 Tax=Crossiella equi TaxID=130796 RepID=A0ABS5ANN7_9PSEU|nr:GGDEF domain-containing protein [Crossiella equi]MBP2477857.1 diguanylate cyclase (GGDEF)-like protein [Crossiella equi]